MIPRDFLAKVTISVERMIRYCYLVQMLRECKKNKSPVLPLHVTRFGSLAIETASFLYSLSMITKAHSYM